jgi:hypothetical protein
MSTAVFMQKSLLDWALGGATPTRPTVRFAGLAIGAPTSISASEATAAGYTRQAVTFGAAVTTVSSATAINTAAFTFTFSAAQTVAGIHIWNSSAAGSMLYYGALSASSVMASADTLAFASAALVVKIL